MRREETQYTNIKRGGKKKLRFTSLILSAVLITGTLFGCSSGDKGADDTLPSIESGTLTLPGNYNFEAVSATIDGLTYSYDFTSSSLDSLKSDTTLKFNPGDVFKQNSSGLYATSSDYDSVGVNENTNGDGYTFSVKIKHDSTSSTSSSSGVGVGVRASSNTAVCNSSKSGLWAFCKNSQITFYVNGSNASVTVSNLPVSFRDGAVLHVEDEGSSASEIRYYVSSDTVSKTLVARATNITSKRITFRYGSNSSKQYRASSTLPSSGYCRAMVNSVNGYIAGMSLTLDREVEMSTDKRIIAYAKDKTYCFAGVKKYDLSPSQKAKCFEYAGGYYLPANVLADAVGLSYTETMTGIVLSKGMTDIGYTFGENTVSVNGTKTTARMPVKYEGVYFVCVDEFASFVGYKKQENNGLFVIYPSDADASTALQYYESRYALYERVVFNYDDVQCDQTGVGQYPKAPQDERLVGVAYTTWRYPTSSWGEGSTWDIPLLGPYVSDDRDVIRQHAIWLADAGVDFIVVDWSNNVGYIPETMADARPDFKMIETATTAVFEVFATVENAPKICIMTGPGHIGTGAFTDGSMLRKNNQIYNTYIANPKYNEMYFYYEDKPLLLCYAATPSFISDGVTVPYSDPYKRFTERWVTGFVGQQGTLYDESTYRSYMHWSWEERVAQTYMVKDGIPECMTVVASYRPQSSPGESGYIPAGERNDGETFRQQWQRANDIGTKIALVVSFNEWTTGEQTSLEVSKDIEPSETLGTLYIDILKEQVKKFKGKLDETISESHPWVTGADMTGVTTYYNGPVKERVTDTSLIKGWYAGSEQVTSFKYSVNNGQLKDANISSDSSVSADIVQFMPGGVGYNTYSFSVAEEELNEGVNVISVYAVTSSGQSVLCAEYTAYDTSAFVIKVNEGSSLVIEDSKIGKIIRVPLGTTSSEVLSQLNNGCSIDAFELKNAVPVKFIVDGVRYDMVLVIVMGDLNSDGIINGTDHLRLKKLQNGSFEHLPYSYAADLNRDGKITDDDLNLMTDIILKR